MKYLVLLTSFFVVSAAQANSECFEFDVMKNSSELTHIRISVLKEKKKITATVIGVTADKKITNDFDCIGLSKLSCVHPMGAGDFTIETLSQVSISFSYVNLAIGGKGPNAPKPNEEINEDFAFLDKTPAANDDEEDAGHLGNVTLKGKRVSCDSKI